MNKNIFEDIQSINRWTNDAHNQIENITSRLTEIEEILARKSPDSDSINILELLDLIQTIQHQHQTILKDMEATKTTTSLDKMEEEVELQLQLLNKTFELLDLEVQQ